MATYQYSNVLEAIEDGLQIAKEQAFSEITNKAHNFDHVRNIIEPVTRIEDQFRRMLFSVERKISQHNARTAELQQLPQAVYSR